MIVKVERCWGGNASYNFRLTCPDGTRDSIQCEEGDYWSRKYAVEALDRLERVYGFERQSIRFRHV